MHVPSRYCGIRHATAPKKRVVKTCQRLARRRPRVGLRFVLVPRAEWSGLRNRKFARSARRAAMLSTDWSQGRQTALSGNMPTCHHVHVRIWNSAIGVKHPISVSTRLQQKCRPKRDRTRLANLQQRHLAFKDALQFVAVRPRSPVSSANHRCDGNP